MTTGSERFANSLPRIRHFGGALFVFVVLAVLGTIGCSPSGTGDSSDVARPGVGQQANVPPDSAPSVVPPVPAEDVPQPDVPPSVETQPAPEMEAQPKHPADVADQSVTTVEPQPADSPKKKPSQQVPDKPPLDVPRGETGPPLTPPKLIHEPKVLMSAGHDAMCLVKVGDRFPDVAVADLDGQTQLVSSRFGDQLTVVLFWSSRQALAREQFRRLESEIGQPFRAAGVNVIAINVQDEPRDVAVWTEESGGTFPCLVDPQGEAMRAVATEKLPRTYVVDSDGQVVWMDIEYSRGSRRELRNALFFHLLGKRSAPPDA